MHLGLHTPWLECAIKVHTQALREILTVEALLEADRAGELLGSSFGDFRLKFYPEVPIDGAAGFCIQYSTGRLLHPIGRRSWLDRKGWLGSHQLLPRKIAVSGWV